MFEVVHENGLVRRFRWKHERRSPTWPKKQKESTLCIVEHRNPNIGKNQWQQEMYYYEECSLTDQFNKAEGRKRSLAGVLLNFPRSYRSRIWKKYFELFPLVKPKKHECPHCGEIFSEQAEKFIATVRHETPPSTRGISIAKQLIEKETQDSNLSLAQVPAIAALGPGWW